MFSGNNRVFVLVFTGIFFVILFIGLLSGVTLKAGLSRAFLAGLLFSVLLRILFRVIGRYALPQPEQADSVSPQNHNMDRQLDFMVSDPPNDFSSIVAKQIDPDLERVINNDPERMAEIVKKMGYDD